MLVVILYNQNGYENTSTNYSVCHESDYNQTTNPTHQAVGISLVCKNCHKT